ncbi:hypothetical protein T439DRAFT_327958 [Meredithblackwellia eburnea MCA 4105]
MPPQRQDPFRVSKAPGLIKDAAESTSDSRSPVKASIAKSGGTPWNQKEPATPTKSKTAFAPNLPQTPSRDALNDDRQTAKSPGKSPAAKQYGWERKGTGENSYIAIVESPLHMRFDKHRWSWLHQWVVAVFLHSGGSTSDITLHEIPGDFSKLPRVPSNNSLPVADHHLRTIAEYLQDLSKKKGFKVEKLKESIWSQIPESESLEEMNAAFKRGHLHFSASLRMESDRPVLSLNQPSVEGSCRLYRDFGSDRFLRIRLDEAVGYQAAPEPRKGGGPLENCFIKQFFSGMPLSIFGRTYRSFCQKDGAMVYFCEEGPGVIPISLSQFCERYISSELNKSMSIAKWRSRFELGLSTSVPALQFRSEMVARVPDLLSNSLLISFKLMSDAYSAAIGAQQRFWHPEGYVPTAIRGSVKVNGKDSIELVFKLDFTTVPDPPTKAQGTQIERIELPKAVESKGKVPQVTFWILPKDGKLNEECKGRLRLKPEHIKYVDQPLEKGQVMTDGCGLISRTAMSQAWTNLKTLSPTHCPSAVQARCGPAKGVWSFAPAKLWPGLSIIELRDSQFKYNASKNQKFELEVLAVSHGKTSGYFNKQVFEVLAHAGVKGETISEMLRTHLLEATESFLDWTNNLSLLKEVESKTQVFEDRSRKAKLYSDPASLRGRFSKEDSVSAEDSLNFVDDGRKDPLSAAPNTINEVIVEFLQSGFRPSITPPLASKIQRVAKDYANGCVQFKLESKQCRTVLVIADPYNILKPGEVFYQASEPIVDDDGFARRIIEGPILASRPPCTLPCDVQPYQAIVHPQFADHFDVLIMSAQGDRAPCSVLSGGDYDGDKLLIITNKTIIEQFDRARADPKFSDPPFKDEDYFTVDSRTVENTIKVALKNGNDTDVAKELAAPLFTFSAFGTLSKRQTSVAYTKGLDDAHAVELAHLFCKSLDGRKQGLSFTPDQWEHVKTKFQFSKLLTPEFSYREDEGNFTKKLDNPRELLAKRNLGLKEHPLDTLIQTARVVVGEMDKKFDSRLAGLPLPRPDEDLSHLWKEFYAFAQEKQNVALQKDLCIIMRHVASCYIEYKSMRQGWARKKSSPPDSPSKSPKKAKVWKGSSVSIKKDLLDMTARFWTVLDGDRLTSAPFTCPEGKAVARRVVASCAYLLPISPKEFPRDFLVEDDSSPEDLIQVDASPFTQPSFTLSQLSSCDVPTTLSSSLTTTIPNNGGTSPSFRQPKVDPEQWDAIRSAKRFSFVDASTHSSYLFCYDMAHRDVMGLKADAETRRLYPGAEGISAAKLAPLPHLAVGIKNKAAAGIVGAKVKKRPHSFLTADPSSSNEGPQSPSKLARRC